MGMTLGKPPHPRRSLDRSTNVLSPHGAGKPHQESEILAPMRIQIRWEIVPVPVNLNTVQVSWSLDLRVVARRVDKCTD
jgi:hypothetical protein